MSAIYKPQDIHISDVSLAQQYKSLVKNNNIDGARQLYNSNAQLKGKAMTADMMNTILNAILALENNYDTNVTQYLQNRLNAYQINIDHLIDRGEFDETVQYEIFNYVMYNEDLYFCVGQNGTKPPIGTLPTNTNYWIYLGLKGVVGNPDMGVVYKGAWSSTANYKALDMVKYQNDLYVARQSSTNRNPSTATTYWLLSIDVIPQEILVSDTPSPTATTGDIWFKIL